MTKNAHAQTKTNMKKILLSIVLGVGACFYGFSQDYVAVAKNGNVYDEANAKYITVNQNNDDVAVIPGMVFATSQHVPGWYKVEYSPGIHAFIPEQITSGNFTAVAPGTYPVANNPSQKLTVEGGGDNWTASADGKSYKGTKFQEILIFKDPSNNVAFSLVDLGNGPIAISYDNSVTKFF